MLEIPSNPKNVAVLDAFVSRLANKYKIQGEAHGNILISLTEAVSNAIIHGNCKDEKKSVKIDLRKEKNCLAIRVSDEGRGFDYKNLPDPTAPGNVKRCGGRGVFLMRQLCDGICYHNNGSTVEMQFKL